MSLHGGIVCVSKTAKPAYEVVFRCGTTYATNELAELCGTYPDWNACHIQDPHKLLRKLIKYQPQSLGRQPWDFGQQVQRYADHVACGEYEFYFVLDLD